VKEIRKEVGMREYFGIDCGVRRSERTLIIQMEINKIDKDIQCTELDYLKHIG
jgi:hypothetical protein